MSLEIMRILVPRNKIRCSTVFKDFPGGSSARNLPAQQEKWVWPLDQEDPLEKEMATHSSILAWEIPWTEEPGRLQPMGLQRVRHDSATKQEQCLNGNRSNPFTEERKKREELCGGCRGLTGESVVAHGCHGVKQN